MIYICSVSNELYLVGGSKNKHKLYIEMSPFDYVFIQGHNESNNLRLDRDKGKYL